MSLLRLAPWICLFAALLLLMQSVWLLHLTFFVGGGFLRPMIYSSVISIPLFFFGRGGWFLLCGQKAGQRDAMVGAVISLAIGFLLMLFEPITSIAAAYTMFFCFFAAIAGFVSVQLVKRATRTTRKTKEPRRHDD
jgi:hypothetical protein